MGIQMSKTHGGSAGIPLPTSSRPVCRHMRNQAVNNHALATDIFGGRCWNVLERLCVSAVE